MGRTAPAVLLFAAPPIPEVRIGFVGVGGMSTVHVRSLVRIPGCRIAAVCDTVEAHTARAAGFITEAGFPPPRLCARGGWRAMPPLGTVAP